MDEPDAPTAGVARSPNAGPDDDWLFLDEVADWTRIPANTLKDYRRRGLGPHCTVIAKKLRYRRTDVERWMQDQFEQQPTTRTA